MTEPRLGDWIQTYTGKQFWPLDPRPEDIFIEDIARALSFTCRFGGHCLRFYSVAEHSVHVAKHSEEHMLWGLLHDASEAYLADVPRPVKPHLLGYKAAEKMIENAVALRFKLLPEIPKLVKRIDSQILTTEMNQNMAFPPVPWSNMLEPLDVELQYWTPDQAYNEFMDLFDSLTADEYE